MPPSRDTASSLGCIWSRSGGRLTLKALEDTPGIYFENWLKSLPGENPTKAKVRNVLSAICSHAMRYGWMKVHPVKGRVRQSAKSESAVVPLEIDDLQALLQELKLEYRVMLLLDVPNGLRRGELLALQWHDFDFKKKTVCIFKTIWHQHVGPVKTKESERVMPLDDAIITDVLAWRAVTPYARDGDWVFASPRMHGKQPLWPEGIMKNHIRPAAKRAGIRKRVSWHVFRHTFSTLLIEHGEDVKTVQSLMRHANPRITMELYTHAIDKKKRDAQAKLVHMMLPKEPTGAGATA